MLIALWFCAAYAPLAPPPILAAILNGRSVERVGSVLGVATQPMISGAVCDPCWVVGGALTPSGWPSGLVSTKSVNLLKYYSGGAVAHSNQKGSTGQMLDDALLCVLWSISPDSYFFAFPKDGVLHAVKAMPNPYKNRCADASRAAPGLQGRRRDISIQRAMRVTTSIWSSGGVETPSFKVRHDTPART